MTGEGEDRLAIQELSARYALGMDTGRRDLYESVWADDAEFRCDELGIHCLGKEAILEYYDNGPGNAPPAPADGSAVRISANQVLTLHGDAADGISEYVAVRRADTNYFVYSVGTYVDSYLRTQNGWRLSLRNMIAAPVRRAP